MIPGIKNYCCTVASNGDWVGVILGGSRNSNRAISIEKVVCGNSKISFFFWVPHLTTWWHPMASSVTRSILL